jgi:4-hydroxy-3-polyprenylbenzoate decarboxylase
MGVPPRCVGRAPVRIVLGVTGASGAIFGSEMLRGLVTHGADVDLIVSPVAEEVFLHELGETSRSAVARILRETQSEAVVRTWGYEDFQAPPSSGSYQHSGMAVVPCSMATVGRIAAGIAPNLICRSADVCLKERRKLVLAVRETPLSTIHLRNLLGLSEAGALIAPASPAFYGRPESIAEMVRSYCGRLMDALGMENGWALRWRE